MNTLDTLAKVLQVVVALGIFNVWLLRLNKPTNYRGGNARTMEEEFRVYGFSRFFMVAVGLLKALFAVLLLIGLVIPEAATIGALGLALLMMAAFLMHVKVRDTLRKAVPALLMFAMSVFVVLANRP
jgi:DoxX-like family